MATSLASAVDNHPAGTAHLNHHSFLDQSRRSDH